MCDYTFPKLANHQINHQSTHKAGCQPGDCKCHFIIFLRGLCGYVWVTCPQSSICACTMLSHKPLQEGFKWQSAITRLASFSLTAWFGDKQVVRRIRYLSWHQMSFLRPGVIKQHSTYPVPFSNTLRGNLAANCITSLNIPYSRLLAPNIVFAQHDLSLAFHLLDLIIVSF